MGTVRIGAIYKASPNTDFWLEADWVANDWANNRSLLRVWLRSANAGNGSTGSSFGGLGYQNAHADGYLAEHRSNPFLPGGYQPGQTRWHDSWDRWFYHDGEGFRSGVGLGMELGYGTISDRFDNGRGHAGSIGAPGRIPKPPTAPRNLRVVNLGTNTFGVLYDGPADDRGAGIEQYRADWYEIFPSGGSALVWQDYNSNGYTSPQGGAIAGAPRLKPGTVYHVYISARNAAGWGPGAGPVVTRTLSAAYVPKDGAYAPAAGVLVSVSGAYVQAAGVLVPKDGAYVNAG